MQSRNIRFQLDFRFQISDFRFQISDFRSRHPAGRQISSGDFRIQISDPTTHKGRNIEGKQISKHAEHISRLYDRFLRDPDFRFQIPKLARFLISDFKVRISDPRTPAMPRQRFQISENRFQRAGPDPTGFRFQISDPSSEQADEASPLQMSECRIQIPGTKKYRLEGPRRRPDNIGQISKENLLSPVLTVWPIALASGAWRWARCWRSCKL